MLLIRPYIQIGDRFLRSDGRGNTVTSCDDAGHMVVQHFDAFGLPLTLPVKGVPLDRRVLSSCPRPNCGTCHPDRGRAATGELGYHGQEGYRTRLYDAGRAEALPTASPDHPDYDANYPDGYESASTGFLQVGARDYDPVAGRFLQPDPVAVGPEVMSGIQNRWAYCANDPVNASDPSGRMSWGSWFGILGASIAIMSGAVLAFMGGATFFAGLALMAAGFALLFDVLANNANDCKTREMYLRLRNFALAIVASAGFGALILAFGFGAVTLVGLSDGMRNIAAIIGALGAFAVAAGKAGHVYDP
jgi:RHS repeat-associated protein